MGGAVGDRRAPVELPRQRRNMPRAHLVMVLDCIDPEGLATFWMHALGYERAGALEQYVMLRGDDGDPPLLLQGVPDSKQAKNRMHIDIHVPDIEAKATELEAAGATRVWEKQLDKAHWITMTDPEGNEFCVCLG